MNPMVSRREIGKLTQRSKGTGRFTMIVKADCKTENSQNTLQLFIFSLGLERSVTEASLGWLIFMGFLYITGALFYAFRIPERFFPGKVDIWVKIFKS